MDITLTDNRDARAKLIEAATPLFARKGFAAVSIRELAEASGVNSALISYHFGGKENLYIAVLENQFDPISAILAKNLTRNMPPIERLRGYAAGVCRVHQENPYLVRFMHSELTNPTTGFSSVVKKFVQQVFNTLSETIKAGIAGGDIRPDTDPAQAAISLAAIMNFYFITKPIHKSFLPQNETTDFNYCLQALEIYLEGVKYREK